MAEEKEPIVETTATTVEEAPVAEAPKYTDKQLNDLLRRDAEKEVKKLLGEAGLGGTGDIKTDLAKLKELRDSNLTAEEKKNAQLAEKDTALTAAQQEAENARYEAAAARLGVPDDKIDAFVKHARVSDGETPLERMKNYIAEIGFKTGASAPQNLGVQTGAAGVSDEERMLAVARKQAGLTR